MDLKSLLNKEQYEGAITVDGQVLILAGAGSGKTRVLTYRMAHMIEDLGIPPYKILAITFTNKAAKEMKDRVKKLVGEKAEDMWISTFHSTCVRILRREIEHLGYRSSFTIYDTSDQKTLLTECMKALNINDKDITQREIMGKISRAKDKMQTSESFKREFESNFRENKIADVYLMYQKRLKENNAMDFDDLIFKTVELFKKNPDVLEFYQRKFQYIMVDEYQDTNGAQYELVKLLAAKNKNICVVGDDDQCLVEGTFINREGSIVEIEKINQGDKVQSLVGNGKYKFQEVTSVSKKEYNGDIVEIVTKSGKVIKGTPNHLTFSKVMDLENLFYVYLIYKRNVGYIIGKTSSSINVGGEKINGLNVALLDHQGDKIWILKVCKTESEAICYKDEYLNKCNLTKGEDNDVVEALMDSEYLYKEYPHFISSDLVKGKKINVNFFGGNKTSKEIYSHVVEINDFTVSISDIEKTEHSDFDKTEEFVKNIVNDSENFEITKRAKLTRDENFLFMPLGSLKEGMEVVTFHEGKVIGEEVVSVNIQQYNGVVYDLNIEGVRNYMANDIVMHNCIYAWRGADINNILDFEKDYPEARVIKLEQNYRSKDNILQAANVVIANNSRRKDKQLRPTQEAGSKIKIYRAFDDRSEGDFVSKTIADLKHSENRKNDDFAILYRTNAQSRIFEETLRRRGIAYKIVGGTRFYDRKEIKDLISYLKVIVNPQDDISLKRIINVPKRSIGDATVQKVQEFAGDFELDLWDALSQVRNIPSLTARNASCIEKFTELMENFMDLKETVPPSVLVESILKDTGYLDELSKSGEIEDKSRIENLKELVSDAVDFEKNSEDKSLEAYLEKISLVQDTDKLDEEENGEGSVVLMTIHSAKGLEFPVVFMVGMENGLFPSVTDMDKEDQMEEARRLCYVAITRAKEILYMTSAEVRKVFGRTVSYSQSDFIGEVKSELKEFINERGLTSSSSAKASGTNSSKFNPHSIRGNLYSKRTSAGVGATTTTSNTAEITMGRKVKHEKFGVGTIVSVTPSGNDKKLTIAFDKQGVKILLLSLAKLEVL
ncbi:UvrD-helicase domain-containing protein [Clostridium sp. SHJSY1]|uniref:UvrD-helicase domain-containing protein n=1 Tax=Clostridium sp. SHJSY1 TaxID=2942483 RepID=UPI0028751CA2|nr:UvrD-helicase domain-containing protein [Clostridium sp. SHJSY1]MDS0526050.1 UvrD-helicase domain-containing protein [Clostridium sp. SHJSY1]